MKPRGFAVDRFREPASRRAAPDFSDLSDPLRAKRVLLPPPCRRDGRSGLQAHHKDYRRPLDVKWLCRKCHGKENPMAGRGARNGAYTRPDRKRHGEHHGRSKVTEVEVKAIRELHARGHVTAHRLGKVFGLNGNTVLSMIRRETWSHVP